jgi:phenylalanyl-tRNA synthetase alpha subunit
MYFHSTSKLVRDLQSSNYNKNKLVEDLRLVIDSKNKEIDKLNETIDIWKEVCNKLCANGLNTNTNINTNVRTVENHNINYLIKKVNEIKAQLDFDTISTSKVEQEENLIQDLSFEEFNIENI